MSRKPWPYLVVGTLAVLLASNRITPLLSPLLGRLLPHATVVQLADPRALWHVIGVVAGIGLLSAGAILWFSGRRSPPLTPHTPAPVPYTPSRPRAIPQAPHTPSRPRAVPQPPRTPLPQVEPIASTESALTAEETGEFERAGELYDRHHDDAAAARVYAQAAREAAADSPERASLVNRALNRARKAGKPDIAVELLADTGEIWKAVELARTSGDARMTAKLLQRAGDHAGAAGTLAAAGDHSGAAQIMIAAGNPQGAVDFLASEDPAAAAKLCIDNGDFGRAVALYEKAGLPGEAAGLLFEEDPHRAAELYLQAGDAVSAAGCFEHAGSKAEAAQVWLRAGKPDRAAPLFEKLGDDENLLRCRDLEGDYVAAARIHLKLGRPADAHAMLGKLSADALQSPAASIVAGDCLLHAGRTDEAVEILHAALAKDGVEEALQCEACYMLGAVYLGRGQNKQAEALLHQVTLLDPKYRDAARLLARLGKRTIPPDAPEEL